MPWARIPPDKLINLPLFGIDVVIPKDGDFFWVRGPKGRMRVRKSMPRVWFDSVEDAMQAGATALRIKSEDEQAEYEAFLAEHKAGTASMEQQSDQAQLPLSESKDDD